MNVVFFRSLEHLDYYFIYKGGDGVNAERYLRMFTHTGEYENSGYPKINIELAYILKTKELGYNFCHYLEDDFFKYLYEIVATNRIPHPRYNDAAFRAWYEFKKYDPKKWLNDFQEYRIKELTTNRHYGIQQTLF